ncbi:hypothetical protein GCK72_020225 [Caenorhabditis remanei]|uniref:Serpentine Receptor, class H n=1 Tax=Caenorhabditis remanei TaxID=31234 RepID=A0A6A5GEQ8_CAERE|nr:hypothetical protein GCK72_020225 [Caenorhabditis remanei]KAF1753668.1 hypothetical protein GCK72_020225 [Caenorhabditis remanei]
MNLTCSPSVSYFDSPSFITWALHFVTVISTPIHFIGLYCILWKTPEEMKSAKWYLLNLHIWMIFFDYSVSFFTIPIVLMPAFAGIPLGILHAFNVSGVVQALIVLLFLGYVIASIIFIFENRFYTICVFASTDVGVFASPNFLSISLRVVSGLSIPIHLFGMYAILLKTPDNMRALKWYLASLHIWTVLFDYAMSVFAIPVLLFPEFAGYPLGLFKVLNADYYAYLVVIEFVFIGYVLVSIIAIFENQFYTVCSFTGKTHWASLRRSWLVFHYFFATAICISFGGFVPEQTQARKNVFQRVFFIALVIQTGLPLITLVVPFAYSWVSVIWRYYNQGLMNIAVIVTTVHGVSSTLVMLLVHRPYRNALISAFSIRSTSKTQGSSRRNAFKMSVKVSQIKTI